MDERRLYKDLAWTWPIISPKEDYIDEAEELHRAMQARAHGDGGTLLHLGCGGGHLDWTLKQHYQITGLDVSETMLALARELNTDVTYELGDMRSVRLSRTFDAVLIADSIDYMLSHADLRAAFETAFVHLRPGGVFCTYAEFTRERFRQHHTESATHTQDDTTITFIEQRYDPNPEDTTFESTFVYLIRRGGELQIETDLHLYGLFKEQTWNRLLQEVGFHVERLAMSYEGEEFPCFVCIKP